MSVSHIMQDPSSYAYAPARQNATAVLPNNKTVLVNKANDEAKKVLGKTMESVAEPAKSLSQKCIEFIKSTVAIIKNTLHVLFSPVTKNSAEHLTDPAINKEEHINRLQRELVQVGTQLQGLATSENQLEHKLKQVVELKQELAEQKSTQELKLAEQEQKLKQTLVQLAQRKSVLVEQKQVQVARLEQLLVKQELEPMLKLVGQQELTQVMAQELKLKQTLEQLEPLKRGLAEEAEALKLSLDQQELNLKLELQELKERHKQDRLDLLTQRKTLENQWKRYDEDSVAQLN